MRVPVVSDEDVRALVGDAAYARGLAYARGGRVLTRQWNEAQGVLLGRVRGSGRSVYSVLARTSGSLDGSCTCPVGTRCKHVAALLLAGPRPVSAPPSTKPDGPPPWVSVLDGVLRPTRAPSRGPAPPLALLIEVQDDGGSPGREASRATRLAARPAVLSDKGKWVRTGASWTDVTRGYGAVSADPAHREALQALHRLLDDPTQYRGWGAPATWLALDRAPGPALWAMLRELQRVGVALIGSSAPFPAVRLADEPAVPALDLHTDESTMAVRPQVLVGEERLEPERLGLMGLPEPAAVYWWADPTRKTLALARFESPLDRRAEALLTMPGSLRVPAATTERFWAEYAPRLAGLLPLTSDDGSTNLPEPAAARLRLTVTVGEQHTVRTAWSWAYSSAGVSPTPVPLGPVDAATQPWRRSADEERLLTAAAGAVRRALAAPGPGQSGTEPAGADDPGPDTSGRDPAAPRRRARVGADSSARLEAALLTPLRPGVVPTGHGGLTGWDTVELVEHVLPALRAVDGVQVQLDGKLPDYREASEPVSVTVGTGDAALLGGERDWFDLTVRIEVDGREVPMASLLRAMAIGEDRVLLEDGLWLRIDTPALEALRRLVEEARALGDPRRPGVRVSRWDVGAWEELAALGVVVQQARAWTQAVQQLAALTDPAGDESPPGVQATLRPYQQAGYAWLRRLAGAGLGGVLADDMGLGKTLQVLAFASWWRSTPEGQQGPLLVVAPTSVVGTWASEAAKFTPGLVVRTVTATAAKRGASLARVAAGADVVVTSYALLRIEADDYEALDWSAFVLDEAQAVKNHESRGYAVARTLRVPVKFAITGTPLENSVLELWALLGLVAPGLFPSLPRFTEHYRVPIEREGNAERLADLRRRIRPLVLRRTKEDVAADLPPRLEHVVEVPLATKHRVLYDRYLARERQKVLGLLEDLDGNRFEIFRSLTLLRRLAIDPSLVDDSHAGVPASKLDHLADMLDEIVADGHRVLVFSQFTGVLGRVRSRLDAAGTPYAYLDGTTTKRPAVIEKFRSGAVPVFLISLKAGGVGLTLTEADYVVLLDPWWNPAVEAQAVDRAHRIGQTRQVMVYRLVAAGTIEDKVMALKAAKARLFDSVLGGGELADARMSASDIRELLA